MSQGVEPDPGASGGHVFNNRGEVI